MRVNDGARGPLWWLLVARAGRRDPAFSPSSRSSRAAPSSPRPNPSYDGGTVGFGTSRSAPPVLREQVYIVIYLFNQLSCLLPAMTRWIPTKREKYGVGKWSYLITCFARRGRARRSELPATTLNFKRSWETTLQLRELTFHIRVIFFNCKSSFLTLFTTRFSARIHILKKRLKK